MNINFSNIDQLCHNINMEHENPVIDLKDVTFFSTFALVYLGMFLRYHNSQGKSFNVIVPDNTAARNYMARQNFWNRFNFSPETIKAENLNRFTNSTSLNDIVDIEKRERIAEEIMSEVLKVLIHNRVLIDASLVAELICEIVDNFARHSECTLAAVAMQYYPNLRRIVMAVGDCGIGIRASLSSNPKYAYLTDSPHCDAAMKAFEPLVSRSPEGGTGLMEAADGTSELGGVLTLATGDGYVIIQKGKYSYGQMAYDLPGVQMSFSIPERSS